MYLPIGESFALETVVRVICSTVRKRKYIIALILGAGLRQFKWTSMEK